MEDSITSDPDTPDATISSVNTSLSGLTGYEEEFNDLRLLIHPTSPHQSKNQQNNDSSKLIYEATIKNLTTQLDNAVKLNEKLKNDIFAKEKFYEEENRKRINSLITKSAQLEAQLTAVRCHIEGLLKQCCTTETSISEKSVYEQIRLIQNEIIRCNTEKSANDVLLRDIKSELQRAKEEIQTRIACVNELKKKVVQQYSSIENVSQYNKELENRLKSVENDLNWHIKSENWYKEQLHNERTKNVVASQDIIKLQQQMFTKNQEIDQLNLNINKLKYDNEQLQILQKKERDGFLKKIESLQLEIINKFSGIDQTKNQSACYICKEKEIAIQNITDEMNVIKMNAENQVKLNEEIKMEKSSLNSKVMHLQKNLHEKGLMLQRVEQEKVDLQNELLATHSLEQNRIKELLNLTELNDALKVKVAALTQEKVEVENAVNLLRNDVNKFMIAHKQLKQNVSEKDTIIADLQRKLETMHNLSQNEDNNMKKINELTQELPSELEITQLKGTISALQDTMSKLESKCEEITLENAQHTEVLQNISEIEQRNQELCSCLHQEKIKQYALQEDNSQLQLAVKEKEEVIKSLTTETTKLKTEKSAMQEELLCLNKQILVLKTQMDQSCVSNGFYHSNPEKFGPIVDNSTELRFNNSQDEEMITEILELISDRLLKIERNILRKEDVNIEMKTLNSESKPFALLQAIMRKLLSIDTQIKNVSNHASDQSIENILSNFNDYILSKMQCVLDKCNTVHKRTEGYYHVLKSLKQKINVNRRDSTEEIIKLKTLNIELKEKLKRYEINNHTLLRKVKEHMKARNAVEKQNLHMQSSLNSLNEAYHLAEVEINNQKLEIQKSDLLIANLKSHIADLQKSLFNVEKQAIEETNQNGILNNAIKEKDNLIHELNRLLEEEKVEADNNKNSLVKLEEQMMQLKDLNAELSETTRELRTSLQVAENKNVDLKEKLNNSEISFLEIENKLKGYENQSHVEVLEISPKCNLQHINEDQKNVINKLELEVKHLNNERWFLQRLCNDLKCALQATVNEKQTWKKQNMKHMSSLMDVMKNIPVPNKCNEALIKDLIEQNRISQKPLTIFEKPLEQLKSDVYDLQKYIKKK